MLSPILKNKELYQFHFIDITSRTQDNLIMLKRKPDFVDRMIKGRKFFLGAALVAVVIILWTLLACL